jgi:pimeloyl-ACP methyl ester carboxylesterase
MPAAQPNGWLVFEPEQPAERGFIFYPGGLVDAQAYAPLAKQLADRGVLTVIVPMPLDLAILNPNEANGVLDQFPQVRQWAIGGHSLGGAMAAQFLAANPQLADRVSGLVLWGARSQADLSELPVKVVSIFGTRDGIAPKDITNAMRLAGLPAGAKLVPVEGGNHSMFGDYGLQRGDNLLTIPLDQARNQIVDATMSVFN